MRAATVNAPGLAALLFRGPSALKGAIPKPLFFAWWCCHGVKVLETSHPPQKIRQKPAFTQETASFSDRKKPYVTRFWHQSDATGPQCGCF